MHPLPAVHFLCHSTIRIVPGSGRPTPTGSYALVAANPPVQDAPTCWLDAPGGFVVKEKLVRTGQAEPYRVRKANTVWDSYVSSGPRMVEGNCA